MKRIYSIISLLLVIFSASAQVDPQAPLQRDANVKYGKLADGMTYYIVRNSQPAERAEYYLLTDVGAIQENENQKGLAHFLEHMCLNGTKNLPGKMMLDYFQSIGASFGGNINASTGTEQTIYMLNNIPTTRPGMIDTALLILHDYSAYVTNDPAEIDKERGVIVEEWRTRRTSDWRMMEELYKYLYKGSKYADCNIIGTKEGLETFPAIELQNFYKTWYHPANQAIVVVGDIDPDEIVAKLEALFVDVPAKENPQEKEQYLIPSNSEPIVGIITDAEARNTEVMMVLKGEPMPKEYRALGMSYLNDLVEGLVSIMFSERFNDIAMRVDAPFLNAAVAFEDPTKACHAFLLDIISKDGASLEAFRAALTEVEKAKRYGFTQEEFNRASAIVLQSLKSAAAGKETRKNAEFISQLSEDFFDGRPMMDPEYELQQAEGYLQLLNVDAINMAFTQLTNYDKDVVVAYMAPEREGLVHPAEQDFVSVINEVKKAEIDRNAAEEAIGALLDADSVVGSAVVDTKAGSYNSTVWQLANGIKVIVRPSDYAADEVCMRLRIFGGESIVDEHDLPSISSDIFGTFLPMAGVADFPYIKLSKQLAGKNVSVQPVINQYSNGFEGVCSPKDFETMMQLTYLYATNPRFEEDEFAPLMAQLNAILPNYVKQPDYVISKEVTEKAFNNPRRLVLSMEMLEKVNLAAMKRVYNNIFSNYKDAILVITGNVNLDTIKPVVEKYIGALPAGKEAQGYIDRNMVIVNGSFEDVFDYEMQTPKSTIMGIYSGDVKYTTEAFYTAQAVNYILDMLYTDTIREEEGASYGVATNADITYFPTGKATILFQFDTDPALAKNMTDLAIKGLEQLATNGPTEEYVERAKENFKKLLPETRISNGYWEEMLTMNYLFGLDRDSEAEAAINAITADSIKQFVADIISQGNRKIFIMNPK